MKRLLVLIVVALVVAGATLPLWASCSVQADACSRWCGLRHYDSGVRAAACRAECVAERVDCMAQKEGVKLRKR